MTFLKIETTNNQIIFPKTLFPVFLLLIKLSVTLIAIFVYAKFSPFSDADNYLKANFKPWDFSFLLHRTLFTFNFYALLKQILHYNIVVHLFISTLLSLTLWYVIKSEYKYTNKTLLLGCVFMPHFLIWSGVVGKEALAIAGFLLIIKSCIELAIWNQIKIAPLLLGLFLGLIERPHYAISYIYLFIISLGFSQIKIQIMSRYTTSQSIIMLFFVLGYGGLLYYYLQPISSDILMEFMRNCQGYFLGYLQSATNRWNIVWYQGNDFFSNLFWGLPMSIIGPTLDEAFKKPIMIPVFFEGIFALLLLLTLCTMLIRFIKKHPDYRSLIIWGFIPSMVFALLINYPFGIFNPGSAIRYKQSLAPLLYFYPLLLMAAIRRKEAQTNVNSHTSSASS